MHENVHTNIISVKLPFICIPEYRGLPDVCPHSSPPCLTSPPVSLLKTKREAVTASLLYTVRFFLFLLTVTAHELIYATSGIDKFLFAREEGV